MTTSLFLFGECIYIYIIFAFVSLLYICFITIKNYLKQLKHFEKLSKSSCFHFIVLPIAEYPTKSGFSLRRLKITNDQTLKLTFYTDSVLRIVNKLCLNHRLRDGLVFSKFDVT